MAQIVPRFEIFGRAEWFTGLFSQQGEWGIPSFLLQGSEWRLYYNFCRPAGESRGRLDVTLVPWPEGYVEALRTPFEVVTYLRDPVAPWKAPVGWEWRQITKREKVNIRYANDEIRDFASVTIVCLFYGAEPSMIDHKEGTLRKSETASADLESLSKDLGRLLEGEQLPDVRLKCSGETFPAHRSVLAARSEVFAAMFRNKMAESETGVVDVDDFDAQVVRQFLQYVYSGKMSAEPGEALASLFAMADKYVVHSLKMACESHALGRMTEGNCVEYLTVADLHGSESMKKKSIAFICDHPEVMLGEGWAELTKRHPELALEVHQSFVRSKYVEKKPGGFW